MATTIVNLDPSKPGGASESSLGDARDRPVMLTPDGQTKTLYFDLSPEAEVAMLARMLYREGYNDHNWGHISYVQDDDTILLNPWEVPWNETKASDILRIDAEGNLLEGRWTVTPAISLHLATHRLRPEVKVAVHHHSDWGTVWASIGEVPGIFNQSSASVGGELALYDEYAGDVTYADIAEQNVRALGDNVAAILAHHGVFVLADSIKRAHQRAIALEQRCKMAWRIKSAGFDGKPMRADAIEALVQSNAKNKSGNRLYHAMIRREVMADPSVLM